MKQMYRTGIGCETVFRQTAGIQEWDEEYGR
jgi:hypothetical protein